MFVYHYRLLRIVVNPSFQQLNLKILQYSVVHSFGLPASSSDSKPPFRDLLQLSFGIFCGRTGHGGSGARFESGAHRCHATHQLCLIDNPPHDERVREGDELALGEGELRILVLGETVLLLASRESG